MLAPLASASVAFAGRTRPGRFRCLVRCRFLRHLRDPARLSGSRSSGLRLLGLRLLGLRLLGLRLLGLWLLLVSAGIAGCAQTVRLRAAEPGEVRIEGEPVGWVSEEGLEISVPPGLSPVRYELRTKARVVRGAIPRDQVAWGVVAAGVTAAACCGPTLAAAGCCWANPPVLLGLVSAVAVQTPALCLAAGAEWSFWTLPLSACGAIVGASPLALGAFAERVPDEVWLDDKGDGGVPW